MRKYLLILISVIALSCSDDNSINTPVSKITDNNNRLFIDPDSLYYGDFVGTFQSAINGQRVKLTNEGKLIFYDNSESEMQIYGSQGYIYCLSHFYAANLIASGLVRIGGEYGGTVSYHSPTKTIYTNEAFRANGYQSSFGNPGRTAKREITDRDGNVHTFVFENGLFVDELLNGVSVFQ